MKLKERKKSRHKRKPNMLGLQYYPWFGGYDTVDVHPDDDKDDDDTHNNDDAEDGGTHDVDAAVQGDVEAILKGVVVKAGAEAKEDAGVAVQQHTSQVISLCK